jgi:hypothetical protein
MKYIVKTIQPYFIDIGIGIKMTYYIKRITNYKKLWNGVNLCLDIEHAHKYCSESTAQKASIAFDGEVVII